MTRRRDVQSELTIRDHDRNRERNREELQRVQHEQALDSVKRDYERKMELMEMEHRRLIKQFRAIALENAQSAQRERTAVLDEEHGLNACTVCSYTLFTVFSL